MMKNKINLEKNNGFAMFPAIHQNDLAGVAPYINIKDIYLKSGRPIHEEELRVVYFSTKMQGFFAEITAPDSW